MKSIFTVNDQGYVAVVEKASYNTNLGVLNPENPLVFCLQDDLLKYYPQTSQQTVKNPLLPVTEPLIVDIYSTLQAHIDKGLLPSTVLDLLPSVS